MKKEKHACTWLCSVWFSIPMRAQAQTRKFFFHSGNDLDAGMSTSLLTSASASTRIIFSLVVVFSIMLTFARQQVKTKYRSGMTQTQGYLPQVVMFGQ